MKLHLVLAAAVLAVPQEMPKHPPYTVTLLAKTKFMAWKKANEFQARLKQIEVYAKQMGRSGVEGDTAGWEAWTFQIAGESKFDSSIIQRAFGDIQCKQWELTLTGVAVQDPKSKVIFLTSYGGKVKVKLMNPRKNENKPDEEAPDEVGKVSAKIAEGKQYFMVRGEIFSHGGTLSILLAESRVAEPPPPEKK